MRLTRRGWAVLAVAAFMAAFTIGMVTAEWCWYGKCSP